MAGNKGYGNLVTKGGRDTKDATGGTLRTKFADNKAVGGIGLAMHAHIRKSGHAKSGFSGVVKSGSHKASK